MENEDGLGRRPGSSKKTHKRKRFPELTWRGILVLVIAFFAGRHFAYCGEENTKVLSEAGGNRGKTVNATRDSFIERMMKKTSKREKPSGALTPEDLETQATAALTAPLSTDDSKRSRTLIMYVTMASNKDDEWRRQNDEFFLSHAPLPYDEYHFLFIVSGCHTYKFAPHIERYPNVELFERQNVCIDSGAWLQGIQHMEAKGMKFERYILLNSSVRGPFIPTWATHGGFDWVSAFLAPLSDTVKLVGTSINCYGGIQTGLHLQGMTMGTDSVGMKCCVRPVLENPRCDANHAMTKLQVRMAREVQFSTSVMDKGYSIASLMLAWHRVEINRKNEAEVTLKCQELHNKEKYEHTDVYYDGALTHYGLNLNPLELMFFKTNRGVNEKLLEKYTSWETMPNADAPLLQVPSTGVGCEP